jgi:hypothetical protein
MLGLSTQRAQCLVSKRDRREAERHTIDRIARVQGKANGTLPRDCLIVNISDTGIRIHAENVEVPDEFIITITGMQQGRRECRVIWRLGFEIGAEFTDTLRGFAHKVVVSRM